MIVFIVILGTFGIVKTCYDYLSYELMTLKPKLDTDTQNTITIESYLTINTLDIGNLLVR